MRRPRLPHPTRTSLLPRWTQRFHEDTRERHRIGTHGQTETALVGALLPLPNYAPSFYRGTSQPPAQEEAGPAGEGLGG